MWSRRVKTNGYGRRRKDSVTLTQDLNATSEDMTVQTSSGLSFTVFMEGKAKELIGMTDPALATVRGGHGFRFE